MTGLRAELWPNFSQVAEQGQGLQFLARMGLCYFLCVIPVLAYPSPKNWMGESEGLVLGTIMAANVSRLAQKEGNLDKPFPEDDQHYHDHHGAEVEHSKGQVAPNRSQNRFRHLEYESLSTDKGGMRPAARQRDYVGQHRSAQYASKEKSKDDIYYEIKQGAPLLSLTQPALTQLALGPT